MKNGVHEFPSDLPGYTSELDRLTAPPAAEPAPAPPPPLADDSIAKLEQQILNPD